MATIQVFQSTSGITTIALVCRKSGIKAYISAQVCLVRGVPTGPTTYQSWSQAQAVLQVWSAIPKQYCNISQLFCGVSQQIPTSVGKTLFQLLRVS
jgi:hypothetical protein